MLQLVRYLVTDEEGDYFAYMFSLDGEATEEIDPEQGEALIATGHVREVFNAPGGILTRYEVIEDHADKSHTQKHLAAAVPRSPRQYGQRAGRLPGVRH